MESTGQRWNVGEAYINNIQMNKLIIIIFLFNYSAKLLQKLQKRPLVHGCMSARNDLSLTRLKFCTYSIKTIHRKTPKKKIWILKKDDAASLPYLWRPGSSAEASLPTMLLCSDKWTEISHLIEPDQEKDLQKLNFPTALLHVMYTLDV